MQTVHTKSSQIRITTSPKIKTLLKTLKIILWEGSLTLQLYNHNFKTSDIVTRKDYLEPNNINSKTEIHKVSNLDIGNEGTKKPSKQRNKKKGYGTPFWRNWNKLGGCIMIFVRSDIPAKLLLVDTGDETFFIELNF